MPRIRVKDNGFRALEETWSARGAPRGGIALRGWAGKLGSILKFPMHPSFLKYLPAAVLVLAVTVVVARPDLTRTTKGDVKPVPADQAPPEKSEVSITIEGSQRVIVANGLPDHPTGRFPNADNPNAIRAQRYRFTMPARPQVAAQPMPLVRRPFGIALNGVLFDPGTAEYWQGDRESGWHYDALGGAFSLGLDANQAHVQPKIGRAHV